MWSASAPCLSISTARRLNLSLMTPSCSRRTSSLKSSVNRWHAYWLVEGIAQQELNDKNFKQASKIFSEAQKVLIARYHADVAIHDLPRVMRLPGFWHRKKDPTQVKISSTSDKAPYAAKEFLDALAKVAPQPVKKKRQAKKPSDPENERLDTLALKNLAAWVPELFPEAVEYKDGYRVSSAALDRDLEEDLSITPEGIKDFGIREVDAQEGKRTATGLVMEYGEKTYAEATLWLRRQLGIKDNRSIIKIKNGQIARLTDAAEAALIAVADVAPIMVRAGMLVRPIVDKLPATHGRTTEVTLLRALTKQSMIYLLNKHAAVFEYYHAPSGKWLLTNPPSALAAQLLEKAEWEFPKVAGVITTPTLRPDGTILDRPGYDPMTQLWYTPDSQLTLPLINNPTREQAIEALDLLTALLVNFPFVTKVDKSVALAAILTVILRGGFDVTPMFLFRAHAACSGKSFLCDLISTIARGRPCPVITNSTSVEEMEKRLGALVLEGPTIISIDNSSNDIGGDLLCQITERRLIRIRILGKSESPECEWRGVLFATGNNIRLVGDMTRRSLIANIDAKDERPELRKFNFDPTEWVMANRGAYIAAAITIARAFIFAGKPDVGCAPLSSYGEWSTIVRAPLLWLGQEDPVKSMEQAREEDPMRRATNSLIELWRDLKEPKPSYTAVELITAAGLHPELRDLLLQQAGAPRGDIDSRKLGNWLMRIRGLIHNGYRIEMVRESSGHGNRYALRRTIRSKRKVAASPLVAALSKLHRCFATKPRSPPSASASPPRNQQSLPSPATTLPSPVVIR